ncbi:hypothetical protein AB0M29_04480 [Streptomyces sp. NPDC051976]|uniref:hypothetical protein n=1 Tax=Streptomyces sp. NPDC051976 TaxID=3154947 RepID=UPI003426D1CD
MLRALRRTATLGATGILLAAGLSATLAPAAHAEVGSHCPITYHANAGVVGGTVYVTGNVCNRPFRSHTHCSVYSPSGSAYYWRDGNIVAGTGQSTANCDWLDLPEAITMQYLVNGTWYQASAGTSTQTIYT